MVGYSIPAGVFWGGGHAQRTANGPVIWETRLPLPIPAAGEHTWDVTPFSLRRSEPPTFGKQRSQGAQGRPRPRVTGTSQRGLGPLVVLPAEQVACRVLCAPGSTLPGTAGRPPPLPSVSLGRRGAQ